MKMKIQQRLQVVTFGLQRLQAWDSSGRIRYIILDDTWASPDCIASSRCKDELNFYLYKFVSSPIEKIDNRFSEINESLHFLHYASNRQQPNIYQILFYAHTRYVTSRR
jgi:hypothetical protein